jgi:subtilisin-like proprotein convertase family protein
MKRLYLILAVLITFVSVGLNGQTTYKLDTTTHNHVYNTCNAYFYDNNTSGNYLNNEDYWITFCPNTPNRRIVLDFEMFNLDASDYMRIYQGIDTNTELFNFAATNSTMMSGADLSGQTVTPAPTDTSGCLTVRFTSDANTVAAGWKAKVTCEAKCQDFVLALDSVYTKYDSLGIMSVRPIRHLFEIDTTTGDTTFFKSIDICWGDSVILKAKPVFTYNNFAYHQSDSTCIYYWSFGDGETDTVSYNPTVGHKWNFLTGYNLNLMITDTNNGGCSTKNTLDTRVRIAQNPIKTVAPLPDICSGEKLQLNVGYEGNSTIIVDSIEFNQTAHQSYSVRTFIPDGMCNGTSCYESPVTFTTFAPGATFQSANELEALCISMEHSFLGDLNMYLVCPTGQRVVLKYKSGGGIYLGIPCGGSADYSCDHTPICDTSVNPIGTCWNYCWSNVKLNAAQGVIRTGCPHTTTPAGSSNTLDSTHIYDSTQYFQTPTQGLTNPSTTAAETTDLTGFNTLIGCPLNGTWAIGVCDTWGADNGWVCEWWMDLGKLAGANWTYQVPIDTVIWTGPFMSGFTQTTSIIQPPVDTNGTFIYNINIHR